jgi:hypothetical protein
VLALAWKSFADSPGFRSYREAVAFATQEKSNTEELSDFLAARYPSEQVDAQVTWRQMIGLPETWYVLAITFTNPSFEMAPTSILPSTDFASSRLHSPMSAK